ncbi:hypothetical protein [Nocardioides sp. YIM 152588]|uniref:hypothetical protein n=1 Tax=Nocardioides sp. YIM 152588 TaxID=3158259 RepID=UPI0032E4200B
MSRLVVKGAPGAPIAGFFRTWATLWGVACLAEGVALLSVAEWWGYLMVGPVLLLVAGAVVGPIGAFEWWLRTRRAPVLQATDRVLSIEGSRGRSRTVKTEDVYSVRVVGHFPQWVFFPKVMVATDGLHRVVVKAHGSKLESSWFYLARPSDRDRVERELRDFCALASLPYHEYRE